MCDEVIRISSGRPLELNLNTVVGLRKRRHTLYVEKTNTNCTCASLGRGQRRFPTIQIFVPTFGTLVFTGMSRCTTVNSGVDIGK